MCVYSVSHVTRNIQIFLGVIVILVSECVSSSHNNPLMYPNAKIVFDCALC